MTWRSLFWLSLGLTGYCWAWELQRHSAEWVIAAGVGTFLTGAAWGHWREERAFLRAAEDFEQVDATARARAAAPFN